MTLKINNATSLELIKDTILGDLLLELKNIKNNNDYINNIYRSHYINTLLVCSNIAKEISNFTEILNTSNPKNTIYSIIFKDALSSLLTEFIEENNGRTSIAEVSAESIRYGNTFKVAVNRLNSDTLKDVYEEFIIKFCSEEIAPLEIVKPILFSKLIIMVSGTSSETREIGFKIY